MHIRERLKEKRNGVTTVLGIEASCDETAAAVVDDGRVVRSNIVASQTDFHRKFGGVVPEIASRAHIEALDSVIEEALVMAGGGAAVGRKAADMGGADAGGADAGRVKPGDVQLGGVAGVNTVAFIRRLGLIGSRDVARKCPVVSGED
jgi:N6-L-threonylcarbamoyladenine synthase